MLRIVAVLVVGLAFTSCKKPTAVINRFEDTTFVKIAAWQDQRLSDSLYQYLDDTDEQYRQSAALAFASVQDTLAVEKLSKLLLDDPDTTTRANAAFALGQTGGLQAWQALQKAFAQERNPVVLLEIAEACGKTARTGSENPFAGNSATRSENLAWAYYRLGMREQCASTINQSAANFLIQAYNEKTRLGAAHFFARGKATDISVAESNLKRAARSDASPEVRMASVSALRKIKTPASLEVIAEVINRDGDYRVRVNAARSLASFPFEQSKAFLFKALNDSSVQVAIAAAESINTSITEPLYKEVLQQARSAKNARVQATLYQAVLSVTNDRAIAEEVMLLCQKAQNDYQKAALIQALGQAVAASAYLTEQLSTTTVPVIRTAAASALVSINKKKEFTEDLRPVFLDTYIKGIGGGDLAVTGTFADALMDSTLGYKTLVDTIDFLYSAKKKLKLPKDYETLVSLESVIAYFENREAVPPAKAYNHPVDWKLVLTIPRDQRVLVTTTKGDIIMRLFVEEAPGSVANFVALINRNYFNDKYFHRVVPNFVVQGGCSRGDGWGGEDYTIRSEFTRRRYNTGAVGMASVGKDTEGTQWFITNSPTPHLDGRYTIFAQVEQGMNVVDRMEVGDKIIDVKLLPGTIALR